MDLSRRHVRSPASVTARLRPSPSFVPSPSCCAWTRSSPNELVEITLLRICVATNPSHLNPSHLGWLIARLRTYFYAEFAHRQRAIDPQSPLPSLAWQLHGDVLAAFASLSVEQREALILIEAAGLSYKAAARICRKPCLTFKKFVTRARADLALSLAADGSEIGAEALLLKVPSGFLLEA